MSQHYREAVKNDIKDPLNLGIIKEFDSEYSPSLILVRDERWNYSTLFLF